jgi:hypothetical protein
METNEPIKKRCSKCGEEKVLGEFYKIQTGKYGVGSMCKACKKQYGKIHYVKNKEKISLYQKKYAQENKEKRKLWHKKYYITYKETHIHQIKMAWQKNKEKTKLYRKRNTEKIKLWHINYYRRQYVGLTDGHVANRLGIPIAELKKYPSLIELKRTQLQIIRALRES